MTTQKEFEDLNKRIRKSGLVMSSVPKKTRDEFVKFAEEEFADNYGACLAWCLQQAKEYQKLKSILFENINLKLDYIISLLSANTKEENAQIKTISGKILKGGNENEQN